MKNQSNKKPLSRRTFLENTAAFAAGISLIPGAAVASFSLKSCAEKGHPSLIPYKQPATANYFCTWYGQAYHHSANLWKKNADKYARMEKGRLLATMLNEDTLLGENGLARTLFPDTRNGLYFVLDDGWDVPIVEPNDYYGSLILDTDKFPGFTGTPVERLTKLNNEFKKLGWRGIGLWVACQEAPAIMESEPEKYGKDIDSDEPLYWVERMKWMAEAGVEYWKVDWGKKNNDIDFREKLTRLAEKYVPGFIMEHAHVSAPYNTPFKPEDARKAKEDGLTWIYHDIGEQGRLSEPYIEDYRKLIPVSNVLRLYDITFELGVPTMLERAAHALSLFGPDEPTQCLLNCEDDPYMGAGLGLNIGVMRHPRKDLVFNDKIIKGGREISENILAESAQDIVDTMRGEPLNLDLKMLEIIRGLNWHRIAPPFPVGGHETWVSDTILSDSWDLRSVKTWYTESLKDVLVQKAPAVICRNIKPVVVEAYDKSGDDPKVPYVVASRHPNGAVAIATLGRLSPETGFVIPDAKIQADLSNITAPVGLFGHFKEVMLKASNISTSTKVWAQDLAADKPVDITSKVEINNGSLIITESVAKEICKPFNESDKSEPGLVIELKRA